MDGGGVAAETVGKGVGDVGLAIAVGEVGVVGLTAEVGVTGAATGAQLDTKSNATAKPMPSAFVSRITIRCLLSSERSLLV